MSEFIQAQAPTITAPRGQFDKSFTYKTTADMDYIYPFHVEEILPHSTYSVQVTAFGRVPTLLYPLMDNAQLNLYAFWAPTRILWDNARKFYGEQIDPGDSIDYTVPYIAAPATTGYAELSLADYFGLPTKVPDYQHIALPFRLYYQCYDWYFRDQNLQDSLSADTDDGPDLATDYTLQKKNKAHDYFTSGLVNLLKDPATAQTLPLGTSADIATNANANEAIAVYSNPAAGYRDLFDDSVEVNVRNGLTDSDHKLYADLSNATAATILQLRQAVQIQAILELDSRSGTRYDEQLYAVYGVRFTDIAYKPEFLQSARSYIDVNQMPQTSNDGTNGDVGDLAGMGTTVNRDLSFTKSFDEPGYMIFLFAGTADLTYQAGLDRMWSRTDRYSYYHPLLQGIGDQATLKKELVMNPPTQDTGSTGTPDNERTFNYAERYAEYKFNNNKITGLFRSNCTQSLDAWHLAEEFTASTEPNYDETFIQSNTPMDRAIAVTSEPHLKLDFDVNMTATLPMNIYSVPGFGSRL
jgi:hypothetical protein